MAGAAHHVSEHAVHHARLHCQVQDGLLFAVVYAGEFGLVGLLLDNFEFIDHLGGKVLGGDLRVVQEEGLAVDGDLADFLSVVSDGSVFGDIHSGDLLEKVLEHVVVRGLEGAGGEGDGIAFHLDGVTAVRDFRGIQHAGVGLQLKGSKVEVGVLNLNALFELLVTEEFGLEDILSGLDSDEHGLTVFVAQFVSYSLVVCGIVERDGGEAHRFAGLCVLQYGLHRIGLRMRENTRCKQQERCDFEV